MALQLSWSVIVLTCQDLRHSHVLQKELKLYQSKGRLPQDAILLVIHDPKPGMGSGSSTLNVLLIVAEQLSAKAGYTVVESQVLHNARVLILHMGRFYPFAPAGRAFVNLPCTHVTASTDTEELVCNIDTLLFSISNILALNSPPGVWVCSTDMMLGVPPEIVIDWSDSKGVRIFSVPSDPENARNHGVLQAGDDNDIDNMFYLASDEELKTCKLEDGRILIAPVFVYMCDETAQKFLNVLSYSPMECCTYLGLDQGAQPCKLAFVWDMLLPMVKNVTKEDFIHGERSLSFGRKVLLDGALDENRRGYRNKSISPESLYFMKQARTILWREFRGIPMKTFVLDGGCFDYMTASGKNHRRQMLECPLAKTDINNTLPFNYNKIVHSHIEEKCKVNDHCVVINSLVESNVEIHKDCVVAHCHLTGPMVIREGCLVHGITADDVADTTVPVDIPKDTVFQSFTLSLGKIFIPDSEDFQQCRITIVFGVHDSLRLPVSDSRSTYCNKSWNDFFARTGVRSSELWGPEVPEHEQSFLNAKIFPLFSPSRKVAFRDALWLCGEHASPETVRNWRSCWRLSLKDVLEMTDVADSFEWQKRLHFDIGKRQITETLVGAKNNCLLPFFKNYVIEGFAIDLLKELDKVACSTTSVDQVARILSCIADVLGEMAGDNVGLRSGPAGNEKWMQAYKLLEEREIAKGVTELAKQRDIWLGRHDLLIRAARHYEGAMQILVRHAVKTAHEFVKFSPNPTSCPAIGTWFIAEAPARIDLSGAWSDTPPVTYEHGGAVTNVAVKIRGKKPVGAKVRKIPELQLQLVIRSGQDSIRITCNKLSDLKNYSQPNAPGALLKAALCCANIIDISSSRPLQQQLREKYGAGFEVQSWSNLPKGSGLGASSILAGTLMAALLSAAGFTYDNNSLIHAVLHLEQMLTTGGGWQDQVGGLLPGIKIGRSKGKLPLKVESAVLDISEKNKQKLLDHSLLIFTGKPRLAKNMLQGVVRNWYTRKPEVIRIADWIVSNAENCAVACVEGDLKKIGQCLNNSWEQKKVIAPGCEPPQVRELIDVLTPHIHGFLLTGAGGGGFFFAITKEPLFSEKVGELIRNLGGDRSEEVYKFEFDEEGLTVRTE